MMNAGAQTNQHRKRRAEGNELRSAAAHLIEAASRLLESAELEDLISRGTSVITIAYRTSTRVGNGHGT